MSENKISINDIVAIFIIIVFSIIVRLIFLTGFYGSDDVLYCSEAIQISNGCWNKWDYIGAIRYGINIPIAIIVKLLGKNEISLHLWGFLCSIGEIVIIFKIAYLMWGRRVALLSSIIIGFIPLHVHYTGRACADTQLAFFITLSFYLFYLATKRDKFSYYFYAGISAGFTFWIKEAVCILYISIFFVYWLIWKRYRKGILWFVSGTILMIGLNCLLMWKIQGDPFHIINIASPRINYIYFQLPQIIDTPWFYFKYMFIKIYHLWIMPYLTCAGIILMVKSCFSKKYLDEQTIYIIIWALGLLFLLTFTIISLNPVKFIAKQVNYMIIFLGPFSILAGFFLSKLGKVSRWAILIVYLIGAIILSGLEQQVIHRYVSNSKSTIIFANEHPDADVYGVDKAVILSRFTALLDKGKRVHNEVKHLSKLNDLIDPKNRKTKVEGNKGGYAIIDWEIIKEGGGRNPEITPNDIPESWQKIGVLQPSSLGAGGKILSCLLAIIEKLPEKPMVKKIKSFTLSYLHPQPADIYLLPKSNR